MFRRVGLSLLTAMMFALLQGTVLFAGITNGFFDQDLSIGWTYSEDNINHVGGSAVIQKTEGGVTFLQQDGISGPGMLSFDLRYEFGDFTETIYFNAMVFNGTSMPNDNPFVFYSISTELDLVLKYKSIETTANDTIEVVNLGDGKDLYPDNKVVYWSIRHISVPVLSTWGDFTLRFEVTDYDTDPITVTATLDNVELTTTVPEPATMTLGLIGVGIVGAIRKRIR